MRRSSTLPWIALVSAIAITMGSGAIAQALSDAVEAPPDAAETAEPAPQSAITPPPAIEKKLHTVPEDGDGAGAFDFVPRWLRALLDSRPNEDLIVCLAGCPPHRDRIVYARLKDLPEAPVAAAQPAPIPAPASEADAPPTAPALAPAAVAAPSKDEQPAFVPTFNLPLENADEAKPNK